MKRCFKWLVDWFTQWGIKMGREEKISCVIGGIFGIVVGICVFTFFDTVPATAIDYEPLEKQMAVIQQNPELLLQTNCNINVNNDVITVNLENNECQLTVQYDQNFQILSTSKVDNCTLWPLALFLAVVMGFATYVGTFFMGAIGIYLLENLMAPICRKFREIKPKKV